MQAPAPRAQHCAFLRVLTALALFWLAVPAALLRAEDGAGEAVAVGAAAVPEADEAPPQVQPLQPLDITLSWAVSPADQSRQGLRGDPGELVAYLLDHLQSGEAELGLSEAVTMALRQNHALNQKRLEALAACQGRRVIWADLKPQLSLDARLFSQAGNGGGLVQIPGGRTLSFGTDGDLVRSLALSLTKRIYDFGLTQGLLEANSAQTALQHYSVRIAEQQLVAAVADSYLAFSLAVGQLRLRQDELALALDFEHQTQVQYDVGVVPRLDAIRAGARVEQARDALTAAQAQLGDSAAYFYSLLGAEDQRYVPQVIAADLLQLSASAPDLEQTAQCAQDQRPEIELQYSLLFAGESKLDLARNRPMLQAYANAQWQVPAASSISGTDNYEFGMELLWKLASGGKDAAEREVARTQLKALSEGVLDLEAKVELDATTAYNRLARARARVASARHSLDLSAEALRSAAVGYGAGVTPYLDYQSALDQNVAAAQGYLAALIEVKRAQVNLDRAQGFPSGYSSLPELAPVQGGTKTAP